MKSPTPLILAILSTLTFSCDSSSTDLPQDGVNYTYTLERSEDRSLSHDSLTFIFDSGSSVWTILDKNGDRIPHRVDSGTNERIFSTNATQFSLNSIDSNAARPSVRITPLYDNLSWAWSHGFDDNVGLHAQAEVLNERGLTATLFMISDIVDDTREENWIFDKPDLIRLMRLGWSLGNHSSDHACDENADFRTKILDGHTRLREVLSGKDFSNFQITSFAAPCFVDGYHQPVLVIRDSKEVELLFNESGGGHRMLVDSSFDFNRKVGRDVRIPDDVAAVIAEMEDIDANASPAQPIWYNSLTHGDSETELAQVADHFVSNYRGKAWMAPSDKIYSYIWLREHTVISH